MTARRRKAPHVVAALASLVIAVDAVGARCAAEDLRTSVSGVDECLAMSRFGPDAALPGGALVVWLHGDVSSGGPATYHVALAERTARDDAWGRTTAIALVRPGYPAADGRASTGDLNARNDHYTAANAGEVAAALAHLKQSLGAGRLVVAGHSGGAATAALVAGMRPGLIDAMLLLACPCDIAAWRQGRRAWTRSENPIAWAGRVATDTRVVALTGARDDNTSPALASAYVDALKARGVNARFDIVADESHNGIARSDAATRALRELVGAP